MNIFIALLALSFLIIVHEFGHFIVAKLSGIIVHDFSLFMGPKLFSFKKGETTYAIRAIPLGGYVRMEGEEQSSDNERAYNNKPIYIRAAVIAAGPIMNLIIAVILFFVLFSFKGYDTNIVSEIAKDSPAIKAQLQQGDKIISYNGKQVFDINDLALFTFVSKGEEALLEIERGGESFTTKLKPEVFPESTRYLLGFVPKDTENPTGVDSNLVASVSPKSPGQSVGLQTGDRITKINDKKISNKQELSDYLAENKELPVVVTVERDGKPLSLGTVTPMAQKVQEQYFVGMNFATVKGNFGDTLKQSFISCYSTTRQMYSQLIWLLTGKVSTKYMMGPVGIVSSIGQIVEQSPAVSDAILNLLRISALISVNLGIFNLIPFPALDGSKLLFLLIEGVRRKPLQPEKEAAISLVGFALLILLMIYATSNDIIRLIFGQR